MENCSHLCKFACDPDVARSKYRNRSGGWPKAAVDNYPWSDEALIFIPKAMLTLVWGEQKRECNRVRRLVWAMSRALFIGAVSLYFVIWVSLDNNSGSLKLLKLNCDWSTDSRRRNSSEQGVALRLVKKLQEELSNMFWLSQLYTT